MKTKTASRSRTGIYLLLALVVLLAVATTVRNAWAVGEVGDAAPDFSLQNTDGETVEVAFGQGEVWLIAFIGYS